MRHFQSAMPFLKNMCDNLPQLHFVAVSHITLYFHDIQKSNKSLFWMISPSQPSKTDSSQDLPPCAWRNRPSSWSKWFAHYSRTVTFGPPPFLRWEELEEPRGSGTICGGKGQSTLGFVCKKSSPTLPLLQTSSPHSLCLGISLFSRFQWDTPSY